METTVYPTNEKPLPPDQKILDILSEALRDAVWRSAYFLRLHDMTEDIGAKETLRRIRMTRQKHIRLIRDIYRQLTGEDAIISEPDNASLPHSKAVLAEECAKGCLEAIEAVEFYRMIYFGFVGTEMKDRLFEIITDEQNIAIQLNYLLNRIAG